MLRPSALFSLGALLAQLCAGPASGQTLPGLPPDDLFRSKSYILDPQLEKDADQIKNQTYSSTPVGQQKNWNLDIGYFDRDYSDEAVDLRERFDDLEQGFTGIRLNVPLTGGQ
jgi:hypothetical protein